MQEHHTSASTVLQTDTSGCITDGLAPSSLLARFNQQLRTRLLWVVLGMFGFGYALGPLYNAICEATGINILAVGQNAVFGTNKSTVFEGSSRNAKAQAAKEVANNSQVDASRTITVEFDTNARGPWQFKPSVTTLQVNPGSLQTVVYEFQNVQNRPMVAQAIPSYAPKQATAYFNKLECFCFSQYTLAPGEKKSWPVVFVIDPKLPKNVTAITLSYTFFEVPGKKLAGVPSLSPTMTAQALAFIHGHGGPVLAPSFAGEL